MALPLLFLAGYVVRSPLPSHGFDELSLIGYSSLLCICARYYSIRHVEDAPGKTLLSLLNNQRNRAKNYRIRIEHLG